MVVKNNKMKTIFLMIGESSSGKDCLVEKLCKETELKQLKSYTTRERRKNEGETHIFISSEDVKEYSNDMIAYTKIGNFEYFATVQQLYDSDIYIIDPIGVDYLKLITKYKNITDIRFVTIYINTPPELRKERALNQRKDNPEVYYQRVLDEQGQFTKFKACGDFDYAILNVDFDKAYKILNSIISVEYET